MYLSCSQKQGMSLIEDKVREDEAQIILKIV